MESESSSLSSQLESMKEQRSIILQLFQDERVTDMLLNDLKTLPKNLYSLQVVYEKLIITVFLSEYKGIMSQQAREQLEMLRSKKSTDIESRYVIVVRKRYPLKEAVRVHLLEGGFQPRVSDGRDLFVEVMGRAYEWQIPIGEVVRKLADFDAKLHHKNQLFLEMQKVGHFQLGDTYYYQQLSQMYQALALLKDLTPRHHSLYVGITETHILVFREIADRVIPSRSFKGRVREGSRQGESTSCKLKLSVAAEMQCIDTLVVGEEEGTIKILLKKYRSVQGMHDEGEEITKQFRLAQPEIFLRGVLRYITKFQTCHIQFEPAGIHRHAGKQKSSSSELERTGQEEYACGLISQSNMLQRELGQEKGEEQRRHKIDLINKHYQSIIEYYSARINPYYLIYVNKLNYLYMKYFSRDPKQSAH